MRLPIITTLAIDNFSGGVINVISSGVTNAIYNQYADGTYFITQRPSMNIFEDASATVADAAGRGIYYWTKVNSRYFVNNDTVYKGDYSSPLGNTLSAGMGRVYFFEVGEYLVILDPENQEGWYINSGSSTTLTQITDTDFPSNQTPALTLCKGGAVINGALYVFATDGTIWGCNTEDPTSWGALNFISAEISPDNGVFLSEHGQNIAAFGVRSLEFFYDSGSNAGSPLAARTDIDYAVGAIDHNTVWNDGERLFFVNLNPAGDLNVSLLNNFQLTHISTSDIDTFLTSTVTTDNLMLMASGFTAAGRSFYIITVYYVSSTIMPLTSLAYDTKTNTWQFFELMFSGVNDFPLVDWTRSTETRAGDGILSNGDIVTVADDKNPQDTIEAQIYVVADYVENGYISDTGGTGTAIEMIIVTGQQDFGKRGYKRMDNLRPVTNPTSASQFLTVQWSNDGNNNYNTGRTLDLSNQNNKLTRLGRFRSRNHKLTFSGTEQIELIGLDVDVS